MTISLITPRWYTNTDPYHYTIDNRPLEDIDNNCVTLMNAFNSLSGVGLHTIWVPASAIIPNFTDGAVANAIETPLNKVMLSTLDFVDGPVNLRSQFTVRMPKAWDLGQVLASFTWTSNSATSADVVWGIQAVATSSSDPLDISFGTPQLISSTNTGNYLTTISAPTSLVTISGTPISEDLVAFRVFRAATDSADTFSGTASLLGVSLYYNGLSFTDN